MADAQFEVASAATKNGFEMLFEGVMEPEADEDCESAGDIAAWMPVLYLLGDLLEINYFCFYDLNCQGK